MPVLQLDDQKFPLKAGDTRIGAGASAEVVVPGYSAIPIEAIIFSGPRPTIRRADDEAHVRVNGVLLGAEPMPLMHGDKVEIAGLELRYADDDKAGATQFVSSSEIASMQMAKRSGTARATSASGGRLVSLVDGKEYNIPDLGLVFGRDASCDVVVAQGEVSRRHAEIAPDETGYVVRDTSANGVFVNGERIQGTHRLARADVVRIGTEEFRFYADVIAPPIARTPTPAKSVEAAAAFPAMSYLEEVELLPEALVVPVPPRQDVEAPPQAAAPALPTVPSRPAAAPPQQAAGVSSVTPVSAAAAQDPRPVLGILEALNEGPGKGTKYELRSALGHVGRGAHNDVRLSDESVSETHAKLQRREDGWYVVDMDSTNGTYVGGSRVIGERRLDGSPDIRFGGMKFRFTSVGTGSAAEQGAKGTRAIAGVRTVQSAARTPTPPISAPAQAAPEPAKPAGGVSGWVWIVLVILVAAALAWFFVFRGRA